MHDPYQVLELSPDSDEESIRRRYLELVKKHPPGQDPEQFSLIRKAYEQLRDLPTQIEGRLFREEEHDQLETILEELACLSPRPRVSLTSLLSIVRMVK